MNIIPLAAESLGVRSAAFFVETADLKVLIDPGVSLAAVRYGLPPHPLEIKAMNESWAQIKNYAALADVLIITHYHFDHYDSTEPVVFNNKTLLIKHPKENINSSQQERAKAMIKSFRTLPRRVEFADGNEFTFNSTRIRFSRAVPHGPSTKVGWVVEASIQQGDECFLHSSDIQGACLPEHMEFIRAEDPSTLYLDGPLTYMLGREFTAENLRAAIRNISELLETTRVQTIILDHHLLRDQHWKETMAEVFAKAEKNGKKVVTAADFLDREDEILEAHRQQLFAWHPDMLEEPIKRSRNFHLVKDLGK
jgi:hypothetical protein